MEGLNGVVRVLRLDLLTPCHVFFTFNSFIDNRATDEFISAAWGKMVFMSGAFFQQKRGLTKGNNPFQKMSSSMNGRMLNYNNVTA